MKNKRNFFIIIRGPLGVGKTTIAKALAKQLKGKYISVDDVLSSHHLYEEGPDGYCSENSFLKANKVIIPETKKNLKEGKTTVIDGNFYRKSQLEDLLAKLNSKQYVFTLKAPVEECIKRDKKREKPLGKDATVAVYKVVNKFDYGIVMKTGKQKIEETVDKIVKYLNT